MNYIDLSKEISYALRHAPQEYGLEIDENGWVELNDLIQSLKRKQKYEVLEVIDIEKMAENSDKKRHEIHQGRIRAIYGHSLAKKIKKIPEKPPDILYHGTANRFIASILKTGLQPKERQYIYLSESIDMAVSVGKRRDSQPVVIKVNSKQAYSEGIAFYYVNDKIWLSDDIPVKCLEIIGKNMG